MEKKKESANWVIALIHFASVSFTSLNLSLIFAILINALLTLFNKAVLAILPDFNNLLKDSFFFIDTMLATWLCVRFSSDYINRAYIIKNSQMIIILSLIYMIIIGVPFTLFSIHLGPIAPALSDYIFIFTTFITMLVVFYIASRKYIKDNEPAVPNMAYKDPEKKVKSWIIAVVVLVMLGFLIIMGIITLKTMDTPNKAKNMNMYSDEAIKATLKANIAGAQIFLDDNESLDGFQFESNLTPTISKCTSDPIINISPDKQTLAIFMKSCVNPAEYFCVDTKMDLLKKPDLILPQVDEQHAKNGASSCGSNSSSSNPSDNSKQEDLNVLDDSMKNGITQARYDLEDYKNKNKTYKGFISNNWSNFSIDKSNCHSEIKAYINSDGSQYVIYQPLCSNLKKSYCIDDSLKEIKTSETEKIEKTYRCN